MESDGAGARMASASANSAESSRGAHGGGAGIRDGVKSLIASMTLGTSSRAVANCKRRPEEHAVSQSAVSITTRLEALLVIDLLQLCGTLHVVEATGRCFIFEDRSMASDSSHT